MSPTAWHAGADAAACTAVLCNVGRLDTDGAGHRSSSDVDTSAPGGATMAFSTATGHEHVREDGSPDAGGHGHARFVVDGRLDGDGHE